MKQTRTARQTIAMLAVIVPMLAARAGPRLASAEVYFDYECTLLSELARQDTLDRLRVLLDEPAVPVATYGDSSAALHICAHATQAATSGFSAAMAQFGVPVTWGSDDRGPYCSAARLSQCFPTADPSAAPLSPDEQRLLASTWRALRDRLIAGMEWGAASDSSNFTVESMQTGGEGTSQSSALE